MNRKTENFPSFSQNGILSGSLKKKRKNRTRPVKACSSKQTIPRMVTVPLRLTIRRKHYSISCYLIGLCTLPRGLALPDCSRGIDVPELIPLPAPSPSPLLDKSTPRLSLSLSLSLCNTSVLNTRHIRVTPFVPRRSHTIFPFDRQFNSYLYLPGYLLTFSLEPSAILELERVVVNCYPRIKLGKWIWIWN